MKTKISFHLVSPPSSTSAQQVLHCVNCEFILLALPYLKARILCLDSL
jgi:hypothetical protein